MKPLRERLNEQLDQHWLYPEPRWHYLSGLPLSENELDLELADLLALAWSLRAAPQLRVNPRFARQMERRLLRYSAASALRKEHVILLKRWLVFIHRCRQQE